MKKKEKINWLPKLIEIPIIVGSILLALYFENWNEQLNQKAAEQDYLENLKNEFTINLNEVSSDQQFRSEQINICNKLIDHINAKNVQRIPNDSLERWLQYVLPVRFYSPTHAVLNDIINSGNINLIESAPLRRALMRYTNLVQKGITIEQLEFNYIQALEQYLIQHGCYRFFLNDDSSNSIRLERKDRQQLENVMNSPQFLDYLYGRVKKLEETVYFTSPKNHVIERIISIIDLYIE
ncbi:MAG: hypothetical protein KDD94_09955 [Calditrichaeota bacterium]|nr:hypothetical protein [Calditrichota bacterium]